MSGPSIAPQGSFRQPPRSLNDDTVRLLARAVHAARGVAGEPAIVFEALSHVEQLALEQEAVRIIREGEPLAQQVALYRAAAVLGVGVERIVEAFAAYDAQLVGV